MPHLEYAVIVNVFASDVDEAADAACQFLTDGGTPDAVLPTDKVELLISALMQHITKESESADAH